MGKQVIIILTTCIQLLFSPMLEPCCLIVTPEHEKFYIGVGEIK